MADEKFDVKENQAEATFGRATKYLERHTAAFNQQILLRLGGLYKQATVGPCTTAKPVRRNSTERAKWKAWKELDGMDKSEAMGGYVELLTTAQPEWDEEHGDGASALGDAVSRMDRQSLFDAIVDGDVQRVKEAFADPANHPIANERDDDSIGMLHFASNPGNVEILRLLLDVPQINIDLQDGVGQTPLHYASIAGNRECVQLLLDRGADRTLLTKDGESCAVYALNDLIKNLVL